MQCFWASNSRSVPINHYWIFWSFVWYFLVIRKILFFMKLLFKALLKYINSSQFISLHGYFQTDHRAVDIRKRDFYLDNIFAFTNWIWENIWNLLDTGRKLNVHKTFWRSLWTSSERLIYVKFTSCVQGVAYVFS